MSTHYLSLLLRLKQASCVLLTRRRRFACGFCDKKDVRFPLPIHSHTTDSSPPKSDIPSKWTTLMCRSLHRWYNSRATRWSSEESTQVIAMLPAFRSHLVPVLWAILVEWVPAVTPTLDGYGSAIFQPPSVYIARPSSGNWGLAKSVLINQ